MKFKSLTKIFLFVMVSALFSCSSSEDNGSGGGTTDGPTSISVTASSLFVDFGTDVTFTVKTNDGTVVTSDSAIQVNGTTITGAVYNAPQTGEYSVAATYEGLTSSPITVNVLPVIVDIDVQTSQANYNLGERIDFRVMAIDNDGNQIDVTNVSEVFITGNESYNTGSIVIPGVIGDVEAYATFDAFTSEPKTVTVEDNGNTPGSFTKKALIEDFTGTWCGWCPRVSQGIELCLDSSDNVVPIGVHIGDFMENSYGSQIASSFGVNSFPTAYINRSTEWAYPENSNVNQVTSQATGTTQNGIAINSAIKGRELSFIVSAGFGQNVNGARVVVFLLENGITANQANYTGFYGGVDPIPNFVHDHVLRYSFTSVMGDAVPAGQANSGNSYRLKYDYSLPTNMISNPANVEIVAMILDSNGDLINVNVTKAGEWTDFN